MRRIALLLLLTLLGCASASDAAGPRTAMSSFMDALNNLDEQRIVGHK